MPTNYKLLAPPRSSNHTGHWTSDYHARVQVQTAIAHADVGITCMIPAMPPHTCNAVHVYSDSHIACTPTTNINQTDNPL